ncbi:hypothetical protein MAIT1_02573 [Magnetofaba australis IT-1]|uniref:Uncharacterized protein n=1 Tax=Magnetofaba australis IT-1 TaxID=1434232 RepID=A0A1Y2K398_9PROT|nr:hypothetical protein MAIT1_02573 [Magnetofaba australis IT-1]
MRFGHEQAVRNFLAQGAGLESEDPFGKTPLMWAAQRDQLTMVKLLLANGAKVSTLSSRGVTALDWASQAGHVEIVKALLETGANPNTPSRDLENPQTPLKRAVRSGHQLVVETLLRYGARTDLPAERGHGFLPPLILAVVSGNLPIAEMLLAHGADPNEVSAGQRSTSRVKITPLYAAIFTHQVEMTRLLLAHGANPDQQQLEDPLYWAVMHKWVRDPFCQSIEGVTRVKFGDATALAMARLFRNPYIVYLLAQYSKTTVPPEEMKAPPNPMPEERFPYCQQVN